MNDKIFLKEKVSHGSISFPLCVYNNDLGFKEHLLDYHWHNEIEFLYLSQGKAVFQIDTTPVELREHEAIFINRGEIHSGYSLDHSHCVYYSIVFSLEMLYSSPQDICYDRYFSPLVSGKYKLPQKITGEECWEKEILLQIKNIIGSFADKPEGYEMEIKSSIFKVFSLVSANKAILCMNDKNFDGREYQNERLKRVLNFIKENYQKKISIDDLIREVNLTRYHFCRIFKTLTGRTPIEYINYLRVNQASRFLEEENRKIMDIAMEVGFENFSYFIRKFKEYKNCTPSEYRKSILCRKVD